jgi:hypothetical protein
MSPSPTSLRMGATRLDRVNEATARTIHTGHEHPCSSYRRMLTTDAGNGVVRATLRQSSSAAVKPLTGCDGRALPARCDDTIALPSRRPSPWSRVAAIVDEPITAGAFSAPRRGSLASRRCRVHLGPRPGVNPDQPNDPPLSPKPSDPRPAGRQPTNFVVFERCPSLVELIPTRRRYRFSAGPVNFTN